jgi:hypothetical protein
MDARHLDALTKRFTDPRSRRRLLGGVLGFLTGVVGAQEGEAKRKRPRSRYRKQTRWTKRQVTASAKKCRRAGAPCEGKQAETCCAGLACVASDRGSARRCTPCAAERASCASDEACCGRVCCRDELIDSVGTCCASRDRCCGSHCCTTGQACDQRFLMCVTCTAEGETCQNPVPFCVCCAGLELTCDEAGCRCVPSR